MGIEWGRFRSESKNCPILWVYHKNGSPENDSIESWFNKNRGDNLPNPLIEVETNRHGEIRKSQSGMIRENVSFEVGDNSVTTPTENEGIRNDY